LRDLHIHSKEDARHLVQLLFHGLKPLYPKKATTPDEEPKIPDPKLFASLTHAIQADVEANLPTVGECAAHLELLEAFYKLRLYIIKSSDLDTTFGVRIKKKTVYRSTYIPRKGKRLMKAVELEDKTWQTRRRQKWAYFLGIAVGRFRVWMKKMDEHVKERAYGPGGCMRKLFLPPLGTYITSSDHGVGKRAPRLTVETYSWSGMPFS
jgi:hypothetical protein